MDQKLVAWGRAVKSRRRRRGLPPLWLFTDALRMPNPAAAIRALPAGLCGVVFRHDGVPDRAALLRRVAAACRARRLPLTVAGDAAGAPSWAGRHLRKGRSAPDFAGPRRRTLRTSSAHTPQELLRARRAGAALVFLSPVFATESHPAARPLGPLRWAAAARLLPGRVAALGGIDGHSVRRLPHATAIGAIGALLP